eukprot:gnl/MRDRNA2_/MRDRNA2_161294_c0_seq1.p1 gnl/MRDRNA2_/MRDRNA2_161294_c0~~gnl/MRDRNA2_/MRDRNA2_161294_c0_seq1.p1  ORF type:complete len:629 (-),score=134.77 gnl/MRDRNA2_/MRDRNA2_161294_c0_seq1:28-1815(-)
MPIFQWGWGRKPAKEPEWDAVMICSPSALRYVALHLLRRRRRHWDSRAGLGEGWGWLSARVCRRMSHDTFLRWAKLEHGDEAALALLARDAPEKIAGIDRPKEDSTCEQPADGSDGQAGTGHEINQEACIEHRRGRVDAINLTVEAANDILTTVEQWHTPKHREAMRQALQNESGSAGPEREAQSANQEFSSVMPTLHSLHMRSEARAAERGEVRDAVNPERLTEAQQLELAVALSREEAGAEVDEEAQQAQQAEADEIAAESETFARLADGGASSASTVRPGVVVLPAEGAAPAVAVKLRAHCLGPKVGDLPEELKISSEQIVRKLLRGGAWVILYESVAEELALRARCAAATVKMAHPAAIAVTSEVRGVHGSGWLKEAVISLPVWRRTGNAGGMPDFGGRSGEAHNFWGQAATGPADEQLWKQQMALIRQVILEFCELEDLNTFLEEQLTSLELAIDTERGIHALAGTKQATHTPNIRDLGRLAFRNYCLLDSQLSEPLCLAAYALIRRLHSASEGGNEASKDDLVEILEVLHSMLGDCDVPDDDFSDSRHTRDILQKRLVRPIAAALRCYGDWDIKGHPSRDRQHRRPHFG